MIRMRGVRRRRCWCLLLMEDKEPTPVGDHILYFSCFTLRLACAATNALIRGALVPLCPCDLHQQRDCDVKSWVGKGSVAGRSTTLCQGPHGLFQHLTNMWRYNGGETCFCQRSPRCEVRHKEVDVAFFLEKKHGQVGAKTLG